MPLEVIENLTRRKLKPRTSPIRAVVIHATGATDLDRIIRYYESADGLQPHYLITPHGSVRRFVPDDVIAYHAGLKDEEADLYRAGFSEWSKWIWEKDDPHFVGTEQPRYRWWKEEWQVRGYSSPLQLPTLDKPNAYSIGVELQSRTEGGYSDEQYRSLGDLLAAIWMQHKVSVDRLHALSHSDVSPIRRCTERGPYDPGLRFSYQKLWDVLGIRKALPTG